MEAGKLVPDDLIIAIIEEKLKELEGKDIILDGFPRTIPQAEALDRMLPAVGRTLDKVILFDLSDEEILRRLTGRRVDPKQVRSTI